MYFLQHVGDQFRLRHRMLWKNLLCSGLFCIHKYARLPYLPGVDASFSYIHLEKRICVSLKI